MVKARKGLQLIPELLPRQFYGMAFLHQIKPPALQYVHHSYVIALEPSVRLRFRAHLHPAWMQPFPEPSPSSM